MKIDVITSVATLLVLGTAASASAQRNKTSCGPDVGVDVTIDGTRGAPVDNRFVSDDGRTFQNKVDKVTAIFQVDNCTHDFTMNLNFSKRSMFALLSAGDVRGNFLNFDRINSVPITTDQAAYNPFCAAGIVYDGNGRIRKNWDGSDQDNYAPCGSDEHGSFVRRMLTLSLDGDERLSFRAPDVNTPLIPSEACVVDEDNPSCGTNFIRVYHPDANTWILRPEQTSWPDTNTTEARTAHRVWGGGNAGYTFVGYENLPFAITVTRQ